MRFWLLLALSCFGFGVGFVEAEESGEEPSLASSGPLICTQPLGKYDKDLLEIAERGVTYLYDFEVKRLDKISIPSEAYYERRARYYADQILDHLDEEVVPESGCDVVIGFTKHDICIDDNDVKGWGIFGLGTLEGTSAVVSTKRLSRRTQHEDDQAKRTVKVINHEIGHVLGVPHVTGEGCLMNDAEGTIDTVDAESGLLCESTRVWIEEAIGQTIPARTSFDWDQVLTP